MAYELRDRLGQTTLFLEMCNHLGLYEWCGVEQPVCQWRWCRNHSWWTLSGIDRHVLLPYLIFWWYDLDTRIDLSYAHNMYMDFWLKFGIQETLFSDSGDSHLWHLPLRILLTAQIVNEAIPNSFVAPTHKSQKTLENCDQVCAYTVEKQAPLGSPWWAIEDGRKALWPLRATQGHLVLQEAMRDHNQTNASRE